MAVTISGTDGIVGAGFTVDNSGVSVTAGVGTFSSVRGTHHGDGANLTSLPAAQLTGALPAISAASLTSIPAANIVGVCTSGLTKTGGFGKLIQVLQTVKKVTYHISLKRLVLRKLILGIADGILKADGESIYEAKDMKVGLFIENN